MPNSRCNSFALTPLLLPDTIHAARNHVSSGRRVPSRIVPAISEV